MSFFDEQVELFTQMVERWDPVPPFEDRVCLQEVSKVFHGDLNVVREDYQGCEEPRCGTLKRHLEYRFTFDAGPCDSGAIEDGDMKGDFVTVEMGNNERGVHRGRFEWDTGIPIRGMWAGTTNCGTHHSPVAPCEDCGVPNHWEGRMRALVEHPERELCVLTGTYAMNLDPVGKGDTEYQVSGAFEGVLICKCRA